MFHAFTTSTHARAFRWSVTSLYVIYLIQRRKKKTNNTHRDCLIWKMWSGVRCYRECHSFQLEKGISSHTCTPTRNRNSIVYACACRVKLVPTKIVRGDWRRKYDHTHAEFFLTHAVTIQMNHKRTFAIYVLGLCYLKIRTLDDISRFTDTLLFNILHFVYSMDHGEQWTHARTPRRVHVATILSRVFVCMERRTHF